MYVCVCVFSFWFTERQRHILSTFNLFHESKVKKMATANTGLSKDNLNRVFVNFELTGRLLRKLISFAIVSNANSTYISDSIELDIKNPFICYEEMVDCVMIGIDIGISNEPSFLTDIRAKYVLQIKYFHCRNKKWWRFFQKDYLSIVFLSQFCSFDGRSGLIQCTEAVYANFAADMKPFYACCLFMPIFSVDVK